MAVTDVGVVVLSPELDRQALARLLETGAALGAGRVIVMNQDAVAARAAAELAAVCTAAEAAGLDVAVEFMPYTASRTLEDAVALIVAAASERAGLMLDVLHLFRSGGSAVTVRGLDPRLLRAVQLCDARRVAPPPELLRAESLGDRRYPGEGQLPLVEVLAALPAGLPMTLEAPVARDARLAPAARAASAAAAAGRFLARLPPRDR